MARLVPRPNASDATPLNGPITLLLRDGSQVRIAPGPYGKGVAVVPLGGARVAKPARSAPREPGKRGRKPRPSTVALRERLESDSKGGKLKDPPTYVKWLIDKDEAIGLPMARTVVYRELKKYK